jgi:flagellar motility protein MotE (MotC chaperone)
MKIRKTMKKVIIYENRKTPPRVFDISTEKKEKEAYQLLFEIFEHWNVFSYLNQIERKKGELEKYKNPEFRNEDQVFVDFGDGYAKQYSEDEWEEEIEEMEREIKTLETKKEMYEGAKSGDQEAIESLIRQEKGKPYTSYRIVEVENS